MCRRANQNQGEQQKSMKWGEGQKAEKLSGWEGAAGQEAGLGASSYVFFYCQFLFLSFFWLKESASELVIERRL